MAAPCILHMRWHEQAVLFQVEGKATMHQSLPLRRAAEQALSQGARRVRVDLERCTYMDSTFLGTLLFLLRKAGDFALVAPSAECRQLIEQMGLDDVYPVGVDEPMTGTWTVLPAEEDEAYYFTRNVVRAHQELASVPGPAGATFERVAQCLVRDLPPEDDEPTELTGPSV